METETSGVYDGANDGPAPVFGLTPHQSTSLPTIPWDIAATLKSQCLADVDAQMECHRELLFHYRQRHNKLVPISRLLPELLTEIFRCIVSDAGCQSQESWTKALRSDFWSYKHGTYSAAQAAIKLTHVSRYWRSVARNDPLLWTEPWMTCERWCWRMLERSKSAPLVIRAHFPSIIRPYERHDDNLLQSAYIALQHLTRIKDLCISFPFDLHYSCLLPLLNAPAPALRSLCLFNDPRSLQTYPTLPTTILGGLCPPVTSLTIGGFQTPFNLPVLRASTITSLRLTSIPNWKRSTLSELLNFLRGLPLLRALFLRYCIPPVQDVSSDQRVSLKLLSSIDIQDDLASSVALLHRLSDVPTSAQLHIVVHAVGQPGEPEAIPSSEIWGKVRDLLKAVSPFCTQTRTCRIRGISQPEGIFLTTHFWPMVIADKAMVEVPSRAKVALNFDVEGLVPMHQFLRDAASLLSLGSVEVLSYCAFDEGGYFVDEWPAVFDLFPALHVLWTSTQMLAIFLNASDRDLDRTLLPELHTLVLESAFLTQGLMNKFRPFLERRAGKVKQVKIINSSVRKRFVQELESVVEVQRDQYKGGPEHHPLGPAMAHGLAGEDLVDAEDDARDDEFALPGSMVAKSIEVVNPFKDGEKDII